MYKCFRFWRHIAISGCRSSSQSPGVSFFALGVVENPRYAIGIAVISVSHSVGDVSTSGYDGHIAISGCLSSTSHEMGSTTTRKVGPENIVVAVGIFTICFVVSKILLLPKVVKTSLIAIFTYWTYWGNLAGAALSTKQNARENVFFSGFSGFLLLFLV